VGEARQIRPILCLPIVKQAKLIGALYLENNLTPRAFTSERVAVLELLASQAAISLENASLYSGLERSEAFLAQGQSLSHTGSFGWNISNGDHFWSEETYRIFELDRAVKPSLDLVLRRVHPDDKDLVQKIVDRASTDGEDFEVKYRIRLLDGSVKHLYVIAQAWKNSIGNLEYVGAVTDITATTQAVEALRRSEEHLREVIETIPAMAWTALPNGSIDFVSRSWVEFTVFLWTTGRPRVGKWWLILKTSTGQLRCGLPLWPPENRMNVRCARELRAVRIAGA
jgi:hypothetical protein